MTPEAERFNGWAAILGDIAVVIIAMPNGDMAIRYVFIRVLLFLL